MPSRRGINDGDVDQAVEPRKEGDDDVVVHSSVGDFRLGVTLTVVQTGFTSLAKSDDDVDKQLSAAG